MYAMYVMYVRDVRTYVCVCVCVCVSKALLQSSKGNRVFGHLLAEAEF